VEPPAAAPWLKLLKILHSTALQGNLLMAVLPLLHYPDARLHTVARPVEQVDEAIRRLIDDLADTMYAAPGIGLAASQLDVHKRVIVVDTSERGDRLLAFVNPVLLEKSGAAEREEGCLSVPGIYDRVTRAERIVVEALGRDGQRFTLEAEGLLATCIQHEMDHLEGKVFVEYLSLLKQNRIKTKLRKRARLTL
jgi:peptide deformylase